MIVRNAKDDAETYLAGDSIVENGSDAHSGFQDLLGLFPVPARTKQDSKRSGSSDRAEDVPKVDTTGATVMKR